MTDLLFDRVASPIGDILIVTDGDALCALEFDDAEDRLGAQLRRRYGAFRLIKANDPLGISTRIRAYLAGDMRAFRGVKLDGGGTPFQRRVWSALCEIPPGTTTSYGRLAARLGVPKASRAVGLANGSNPISIVVPCHRVIGAGGALTGYGGGLARKRWLLEHEGVRLPAAAQRGVDSGANGMRKGVGRSSTARIG